MRKALVAGFVLVAAISFGFGTAVVARATMEHQGGMSSEMHSDDVCPMGGDSTNESSATCPHEDEDHDSMMKDHESHHNSMMGGNESDDGDNDLPKMPARHESHHLNGSLQENSLP